ncbi:MAG: Glutathione hydrolase proenzyme [Turneriella sp.]|nr:Glutathione hydrolase proenzyme [Turneriella sp.]
MKRSKLFLIIFIFFSCRGEPFHSFRDAWRSLPAQMQGETQGIPANWALYGEGGAVSTANALASEAGIQILKKGGNAIDALLAIQWVLSVTEPQSSGLGGGAFLLYYDAKHKKFFAFDAREEVPALAGENLFLGKDGKVLPFLERIKGARAVGVPGTVALMEYVKKKFGSPAISFKETFGKAIVLAKNGIRVSPRLSAAMEQNRSRLLLQNEGAIPYLRGGDAYRVGEILYQDDLRTTLEILAEEGSIAFYEGNIAKDIVNTVSKNRIYASSMTLADLKDYRVVERKVAQRNFWGASLFSVSAPASGEYTLYAVSLLSAFQDEEIGLRQNLLSQKEAFRLRESTLEDPDWVKAISRKSAQYEKNLHESENTTHVSIIDAEGNVVSYTSSVEMSMGSALVVKGRGFLLNNQLTDFNPVPGKINSVEGGKKTRRTALNEEAKQTQGRKRPKSSMSPVILQKNDGTIFAFGSPGGPTIVGTNALFASLLLSGESMEKAILKYRAVMLPNQEAIVELPLRTKNNFIMSLKRSGIPVALNRRILSIGSIQAVSYNTRTKTFSAISDLRREGLALVVKPQLD